LSSFVASIVFESISSIGVATWFSRKQVIGLRRRRPGGAVVGWVGVRMISVVCALQAQLS
jgi:NADH:ubiquinone oxidoreductase subunit H